MLIKVDFVKMGRAAWQLHLNKAISPSVGRGAFRPDCVFFFHVCVLLCFYPCENQCEPSE